MKRFKTATEFILSLEKGIILKKERNFS